MKNRFLKIILLPLLLMTACQKNIVINNAFVYLVHEECLSYGKIGVYVNGVPTYNVENYYQWQSVMVGEYSQEVVAIPLDGYRFVKWSDGLTEVSRKDLATNENDDGPVLFYAYFEVINE